MECDRSIKTRWNRWLERDAIIRNLERFQDFIVVSLCIGLFCMMSIRLGEMFFSLLHPPDFQLVTSDILFVLILVELFRLLIIYLREQRVSIGATVEVSIVSALREVILQEVLDIPVAQILGICGFLLALGVLLLIRAWMFRLFNLVDSLPNADEPTPADLEPRLEVKGKLDSSKRQRPF